VQIVYWGGDQFYLYLWVFSMLMLIFLMTVYPDYIAPLFDTYTSMPEGKRFSVVRD
jgi:STE24 endopeptidase